MARSQRGRVRAQRPGPYIEDKGHEAVLRALRTPIGSRERQTLFDDVETRASQAVPEIAQEVKFLNETIRSVDSIRLLGSLHSFDALRRTHLSGPENFGSDAMVDFFAGLVCSQQEVDILPTIDEPFDATILYPVDASLRRIANLQAAIDTAETLRSSDSDLQGALNNLRLENHFDRMSGFETHLHRIANAVFESVDEVAIDEVGFRFSDALRFADLYSHRRMSDTDHADQWMAEHYPPPGSNASDDELSAWRAGHAAWFCLVSAPNLECEVDEEVSEILGISVESFTALAMSMAVRIGSQSVVAMGDPNPVRSRPLIMLSSGEWAWYRPVDFVHGVFDWALEVSSDASNLLKRFDAARQRIAERLPAEVLTEVFGERVHSNLNYPTDDAPAEIDVLVTLPATNIVVECKGGRFSPQGRRAAPKRVEKHAKELIEKAADQNVRAISALESGLPFTKKGVPVVAEQEATNLPIVVTFDRVDPFGTHLGSPSNQDRQQRSWVVALADLIMITEVLPSPVEFYAYAALRVDMVREGKTLVIVEADALGGWCADRLSTITHIPGIDIRGDAPTSVVSATSDWMNDYFSLAAMQRLGVDSDELEAWARDTPNRQAERRPTPGVPGIVLDALAGLLAAGDASWTTRSREALTVLPKEWSILDRVVRTAASSRQPSGKNARKRLRMAKDGIRIGGKLAIRVVDTTAPPPRDANFLDLRIVAPQLP